MKGAVALVHVTTAPQSLYSFFDGQMRYMREQGFQVSAICSPGATLEEFREREGVEVYTVEMARRITPWRDLRTVLAIWRRLRRLGPVIVHAHTPKGGLLGMLAASLAGVPVKVYHVHGFPFMTASGLRRLVLKMAERVSCLVADRVLCVSSSIRQVAVQEGIVPAKKAKTVLSGSINGVDTGQKFNPETISAAERAEVRRRYGIPEDRVLIGFLGRIVRDKGITDLFEAWSNLRERHPDTALLLVGPIEDQDPVPAEILQRLAADPRVHLTGAVLDPAPLYAIMDLLVLPSYREGFGLAAIEAAAMEVPVVATRIPGCVDAVEDGVTGLLVPPRTPAALAEAIGKYLGNSALRKLHGQAGRRRADRLFRQEEVWRAMHAEYLELLAK